MTKKEIKVIERLEGSGTVYQGNSELAKILYHIDVKQEFIVVNPNEKIEGLKSMNGSITVREGTQIEIFKAFSAGTKLTLLLKDGRKVDFFVTGVSLPNSPIQIQPTGGFY